jgi:2-dehydro-3-deoxygluconokinase
MSSVVTLGESMALLLSDTPAPLAHVDELKLRIGGAESNVAIALRRLGVSVTWLGRVGDDSLGELVLRELRAEGLDVRGIVDTAAATGLMIKEKRTADATRVWYYRAGSAGSRLNTSDVDAAGIAGSQLLHLTGITPALSDSAWAATQHALRLANDATVPVSFDVNHRSTLWRGGDAASVYTAMARESTIVFAGFDEALLLAPGSADPREAAERIAALGPSEVIIKLGPEGCYALIDGQPHTMPAVPVRAVDTVGAGDAFAAGYLAERLGAQDTVQRLRTAVAAGAFACLTPGDWEGMPRRDELPLLTSSEPVTR